MVPEALDRHALPVVIPVLRPGLDGPDGPPAALTRLGDHVLLQRLLRSWRAQGVRRPVLLVPRRWIADVEPAAGRGAVLRSLPDDAGRAEMLAELADLLADPATSPGWRRSAWAALHDAESALVPPVVHERLADAAAGAAEALRSPAVIVPGLEVTDSVKRVDGARLRNVDRSVLRTLQQPRLVRTEVLLDLVAACRELGPGADEVAAAQHLDLPVQVVPGAFHGGPVTDPMSLWQAQISLGLPRQPRRHGWVRG